MGEEIVEVLPVPAVVVDAPGLGSSFVALLLRFFRRLNHYCILKIVISIQNGIRIIGLGWLLEACLELPPTGNDDNDAIFRDDVKKGYVTASFACYLIRYS